jgi:tetratricopeptide (TPR) repeat protein
VKAVQSKVQFLKTASRASELQKAGKLEEAETLFLGLLGQKYYQDQVLFALVQICLQSQRPEAAVAYLERLVTLHPTQLQYCDTLANLYGQLRQWAKAAACYQRFLLAKPGVAAAYYNCAYNQRKAGDYEAALHDYQRALDLNIDKPEEVYLNMSVIYSDHLRQEDKARAALETALEINPDYTPALYNLANLYEEEGALSEAETCLQTLLDLDPEDFQALARLADLRLFEDSEDSLIQRMRQALADPKVDKSTRVNLAYALGKALNDCHDYEQAFASYVVANELDRASREPYDRQAQEKFTRDNIRFFSREWFNNIAPVSDAAPIFICGMFRSGSTLTEQILASHPQVTAGGEREFFSNLANQRLAPFPGTLEHITHSQLTTIAQEYLGELEKTFPGAVHVTDKRPDNFLYLGLIKSLFPNARIIHSLRDPLDNCLSVFFLRLGGGMTYATDLQDIAHYYRQHSLLMTHWKSLFADSVFEMDYDNLVADPDVTVKALFDFMGLGWCDEWRDFYQLQNRVKTASASQVREPLYKSRSGRWRNYARHAQSLGFTQSGQVS